MTAVAVVSGGMDSVAMLYRLNAKMSDHRDDSKLHVVSFDYGQRHYKELNFAENHAQELGAEHHVIDLMGLGTIFAKAGSQSSLVNTDVAVPDGHYAEESMKATVVPNRNMIMASIAAGIAVAAGASVLGLGVHAGDHFIYPDCRPEFIGLFERTVKSGNEGFAAEDFHVYVPWMHKSKTDIVRETYKQFGDTFARDLFTETWSCYKGGVLHCGTCGTCTERKEAFKDAGVDDPTEYAA
jgi:7-cyano-7-deazaguanine synthase